MASATRKRTICETGAPVCALRWTDEKNPASAYTHQSRTGITTRVQSRIAFVGQSGETNRGGRLLATVSVLRRQANPTSSALSVRRRRGSHRRGVRWTPSGAATRNPRAEPETSDPTAIQSLAHGRGCRAAGADRLGALSSGGATIVHRAGLQDWMNGDGPPFRLPASRATRGEPTTLACV